MGDDTVSEGTGYKCPCGKRFWIGMKNGEPNSVIHELPTCFDYDTLDCTEFLRFVNQRNVS